MMATIDESKTLDDSRTASDVQSVVQISTADVAGGAEAIARSLFEGLRQRGFRARMLVGQKRTADGDIVTLDNDRHRSPWARFWISAWNSLEKRIGGRRGAGAVRDLMLLLGQPARWLDFQRGREDFRFPATWHILDELGFRPNVVHAHNLHGQYFDLTALPWLSRQVPVVLTLHDAWVLSGHCGHSFDCERWLTGCGNCPDLSIQPAIRRDATAFNWQRKRAVFAQARLHVATPSQWLMDKVKRSILAAGLREARVIPNGIDLSVFRPGNRAAARAELQLPAQAAILLFAGHGIRTNVWKDFATLRAAVERVAQGYRDRPLLLVALGAHEHEVEIAGNLRCLPHEKDPRLVARYYQAADLYVHAARADTFPTTVLEALACGTPVLATAVGGVPEQVRCLGGIPGIVGAQPRHALDTATGALVGAGDVAGFAAALSELLSKARNDTLARLGDNAARDARERFDRERMLNDYLAWYRSICQAWHAELVS